MRPWMLIGNIGLGAPFETVVQFNTTGFALGLLHVTHLLRICPGAPPVTHDGGRVSSSRRGRRGFLLRQHLQRTITALVNCMSESRRIYTMLSLAEFSVPGAVVGVLFLAARWAPFFPSSHSAFLKAGFHRPSSL